MALGGASRGGSKLEQLDARLEGGQPKNFLRPCTLLLLKEAPAHGYDLLDRLSAFGFPRDPGGLYRSLRSLENQGLVHSSWQAGTNGHNRRRYQLTRDGEAWLESWASTLEGSRRILEHFLGRYEEVAAATKFGPDDPQARTRDGGESTMLGDTRTLAPATRAGMLRFIHYGFMPNRLGYCGPEENRLLFDYGVAGEADPGLPPVLSQFLGPLPYLRTIASAAGIADIFDDRVVEAYWLGNSLLDHVPAKELDASLRDRFARQLSPKVMAMVVGKVPQGARAHHSFHVFDVWRQVGRLEGNVLATMDSCRISWGRVRTADAASAMVDRAPLKIQDGKLALSEPETFAATRQVDGKGFVTELAPGDLVSLHWGWVCERITDTQALTLERLTRHHVRIANETL